MSKQRASKRLQNQTSCAVQRVTFIKAVQPRTAKGELDVLGAPFYGHDNGRDAHGEFFTPDTDFMEEVIPLPPVFYYHGSETDSDADLIGEVMSRWEDNAGHWFHVRLDMKNGDARRVWAAAMQGECFASTGAVPASIQKGEDGEITQWLVGELSLIDADAGEDREPANYYAVAQPRLKALTKYISSKDQRIFDNVFLTDDEAGDEIGDLDEMALEQILERLDSIGSRLDRLESRNSTRRKSKRSKAACKDGKCACGDKMGNYETVVTDAAEALVEELTKMRQRKDDDEITDAEIEDAVQEVVEDVVEAVAPELSESEMESTVEQATAEIAQELTEDDTKDLFDEEFIESAFEAALGHLMKRKSKMDNMDEIEEVMDADLASEVAEIIEDAVEEVLDEVADADEEVPPMMNRRRKSRGKRGRKKVTPQARGNTKALQTEVLQLKADAAARDHAEWVGTQIKEGRATPSEKSAILNAMSLAYRGDGHTKSRGRMVRAVQKMIESRPTSPIAAEQGELQLAGFDGGDKQNTIDNHYMTRLASYAGATGGKENNG